MKFWNGILGMELSKTFGHWIGLSSALLKKYIKKAFVPHAGTKALPSAVPP